MLREYFPGANRLSGVRRAAGALVGALVAMVAAAPAGADEGPQLVVNGLARGQVARFTPYVGLPGFGAVLGVAQAEVAGPQARASAGLADLGNAGLVLGAVAGEVPVPLPALPGPVTADSSGTQQAVRDPVVAQVSDTAPGTLPDGASTPGGALEEAHAVPDPAARARVVGAGFDAAGVARVAGGESRAAAVPGSTSSTVTLSRLALGGDGPAAVVLSDLVWTATQDMGQAGTASFSVGGATVGGEAVDAAGPDGLAGLVEAANQALGSAGLYLEAPAVTADEAGGFVSALVVQFRNPEPSATVLGTLTEPAGPVANQVLDAFIAAFPDAEGARLVVNAVLANGSGRSGGRLELGGAAARVNAVEMAVPDPPATGEAAPPFALPFPTTAPRPAAGGGPAPASAAPSTTPAPPGPAPAGAPFTAALPTAGPDRQGGSSDVSPGGSALTALPALGAGRVGGTPAPLVLAGALVAVLALAAGDRFRLRQAGP